MGTWSRPLFTNKPLWKVNLGWFKEGSKCRILNHYSIQTEKEEEDAEKIISLGEFVRERIHEQSKITGHLGRQQLEGWQTFFELLTDYNRQEGTSEEFVDIHLYNIDDDYPYRFSFDPETKQLGMYTYPSGNVYYSRIRREYEDTTDAKYKKVVKFIYNKYVKHYPHIPASFSNLTYILQNTGGIF